MNRLTSIPIHTAPSRFQRAHLWMVLLVCVISATLPASAATIFSDDMTNPASWLLSKPTDPAPFDPAPPSGQMALAGSAVYKPLGATLTSDFSMTVNFAMSGPGVQAVVGLFDATGANGYTFSWESDTGNGGTRLFLETGRVQGVDGFDAYRTPTAVLSGYADPLAPSVGTFNAAKLTWESATHTLNFYVNNTLIQSATDSTVDSFSRIYLIGGAYTVFESAIVTSTVPEPATLTLILLTLGSLLVVKRVRRRELFHTGGSK